MPQLPEYNYWCYVDVGPDDHTGLSTIQMASAWTQVEVSIPQGALSGQATAYPYYQGVFNAVYSDCDKVYAWLSYWDKPFKLLFGWQIKGYVAPGNAPMPKCDAQSYTPPSHKNCVPRDFSIVADTQKPRLANMTKWCAVFLDEDHRGWSANQPPDEWSLIRVMVPKDAIGAQVTAYPANGKPTNPALSSYVVNAMVDCNELYVQAFYWSSPWNLWIGWLFANQTVSGKDSQGCDAFAFTPAHV